MQTPNPAPKIKKSDAEWRANLTPISTTSCARRGPSARSPATYGTSTRRDVPLRRLRRGAVPLRDEVRVGHRLAELLRADGRRAVATERTAAA